MVQLKRRILTITTVPVLVALAVTLAPAAAHAQTAVVSGTRLNSNEAALLGYINKARRDEGLAALQITPGTTDVARRWSLEMARTKNLRHNPSFGPQVGAAGSPQWRVASENVGYASACDPKQLFDAYMNSAGHRKNIMDRRMRYIGIGSVDRSDPKWSCGVVWNTMNFVDSYSSKYGTTRAPMWGLRVDEFAPARSTAGLVGFENGRDTRMYAKNSGKLAKSAVAFDKPSSANNAARLTLRSSGSGSGLVAWDIRDAWDLTGYTRVSLQAGLRGKKGTSVNVDVYVADHFDRNTFVGRIRVDNAVKTKSLTLPTAARSFGNTLELRITNDAVRKGKAAGGQLCVYGVGVA
jgi:uncharacterized protein YkwD